MRSIRTPVRVPALLVLVLGASSFLAACGGGGGGRSTGPTTPSLYIVSSDPADGQQNVPVDSVVRVTFSRDLDPASVNYQSIRVGAIGGAGEVPGQAVLDDVDPRTVRWTPSQTMLGVTPHACEISAGVRSVGGDLVGGDLTFSFRTGGAVPGPALPGRDDLLTLASTLNIGRRSHTATLLGSGQVLIAGGYTQGTQITDRAELFTGLGFGLLTERMAQERAGHTATRLADGRVLLTGGWYEASPGQVATTEWAEIYDPSSGIFLRVGDMSTERVDHAALLLPDGRVLVTGGSRLEGTFLRDLDTAEIFDPVTNTFSVSPELMIHTRATHVMEDLGNGKFLLYGGSDADLQAVLVRHDDRRVLRPAARRAGRRAVGRRLGDVRHRRGLRRRRRLVGHRPVRRSHDGLRAELRQRSERQAFLRDRDAVRT